MKVLKIVFTLILILSIFSCGENKQNLKSELDRKMDEIAEPYVKLILEIGIYKPGYVDAYYGPEEWKPGESQNREPDSTIISALNYKVDDLLNKAYKLRDYNATELELLRYRFLYKQLLAAKAVIYTLSGSNFPFDEEAKVLYDAEPPHYSTEHFQKIIDKLDKLLPGEGNLNKRLNSFRDKFVIPKEKLDTVFSTAINECRKRTLKHIRLPKKENFEVEYVTNKPWGAYNWYKGNSFSVIQVNTDLPIQIDRAIDLAAHEGYPGHHVYNTLLERNMVNDRGWMEFSVYPLYSPQSLIAEGTANYGIKVVFPGDERIKYEKEFLFPLAGLNPEDADLYYEIQDLLEKLSYAGNEAARNYLDGNMSREETINFIEKYQLQSRERAEKSIDFIEHYRSYVINYNLGQEIVKNYIESNGGTADNPGRRWELFEKLLSTPQTPSGLK